MIPEIVMHLNNIDSIFAIWLTLLSVAVLYLFYSFDKKIEALEEQAKTDLTPDEAQIDEGPTDIAPPPRVRGEPSEWDAEPIFVELTDEEIDRDATTIP